jgi:hypothetical protein
LQDHPVAQPAALAHYGVGVGEAILPQARLWVNHHMGQQGAALADDHPRPDHHVGSEMDVLADDGARVYDRRGVNSRRIFRGGVENVDSAGKGQIRVRGPQCGSGDRFKVLGYQHSAGLGGAGERSVFRVGYKGQLARTGLFDPLDTGYLLLRVAMAGGAKHAGEFGKLHGGDCTGLRLLNSAV